MSTSELKDKAYQEAQATLEELTRRVDNLAKLLDRFDYIVDWHSYMALLKALDIHWHGDDKNWRWLPKYALRLDEEAQDAPGG